MLKKKQGNELDKLNHNQIWKHAPSPWVLYSPEPLNSSKVPEGAFTKAKAIKELCLQRCERASDLILSFTAEI